ncbi:MAG: hypothetical protein IJI09_00915 [Clostridia bacterium]|nr:hypothetical protein [Clostridia bacterium]
MKKFLLMLLSLMMICCGVLAEEAAVEETADAITAATLNITQLPEVEAQDNGILVVFFFPGRYDACRGLCHRGGPERRTV